MNKRDFIKTSALASLAPLVPGILSPFALSAMPEWKGDVLQEDSRITFRGNHSFEHLHIPTGKTIYLDDHANVYIKELSWGSDPQEKYSTMLFLQAEFKGRVKINHAKDRNGPQQIWELDIDATQKNLPHAVILHYNNYTSCNFLTPLTCSSLI